MNDLAWCNIFPQTKGVCTESVIYCTYCTLRYTFCGAINEGLHSINSFKKILIFIQ